MKKFKLGLGTQILIGLALGIIVGAVFYGNPSVIPFLQPLRDIFIRLIKIIVVPIIFSAFVVGIERIIDMARTAVNVVGNLLAAVVISKWEGKYNAVQGKKYLKEIKNGIIDSNIG